MEYRKGWWARKLAGTTRNTSEQEFSLLASKGFPQLPSTLPSLTFSCFNRKTLPGQAVVYPYEHIASFPHLSPRLCLPPWNIYFLTWQPFLSMSSMLGAKEAGEMRRCVRCGPYIHVIPAVEWGADKPVLLLRVFAPGNLACLPGPGSVPSSMVSPPVKSNHRPSVLSERVCLVYTSSFRIDIMWLIVVTSCHYDRAYCFLHMISLNPRNYKKVSVTSIYKGWHLSFKRWNHLVCNW